jgi:hypothetical protein
MRPATITQVAHVRRLVAERGERVWDELNGAAWERCFDLVHDGSKFVGFEEAADVIEALEALS